MATDHTPPIRIRSAGWTTDGQPSGLAEDLRSVQEVERTLVIGPVDLKRQLDGLRQVEHRCLTFSVRGGHISLNSHETLRYVDQHGYVLLAEALTDDGPRAVGYQYALDHLPTDSSRFPNFDVDDLDLPAKQRHDAHRLSRRTLTIWRTGVLPDYARLGIGSALKLVGLECARLLGKTRVTANIACLSPANGPVRQFANHPSMNYNSGVLHPWAWRKHRDKIQLQHTDAIQEWICWVSWLAHANSVQSAIDALTSPTGVLRRKHGWSLSRLANQGEIILPCVRPPTALSATSALPCVRFHRAAEGRFIDDEIAEPNKEGSQL